jgi:hypothetical protein
MLPEGREGRLERNLVTSPTSVASSSAAPSAAGPTLRVWGVVVLVFFLLTSVLGGSLALQSKYLVVTLASHIGLALVTLGLAGYTASFVGRSYKAMPRGAAGLGAFSALAATIAGTVFLVAGQSNAALYGMEGFAGIGIVAALLMIVYGGQSGKRDSVASVS